MVKLFGKAAFVGVAFMALAGCAGETGGKVYERVASADGAMEAVLMLCPMASDGDVLLLTGAVFGTTGKGCGDLSSEALTGFQTSRTREGEAPAASVTWQDGKAVFDVVGDRTVVGRFAQAEVPLDLIQLKGSFDEADIVVQE